MFNQLEKQINGYKNMNPGCKIVYQLFDPMPQGSGPLANERITIKKEEISSYLV